MNIHVYVLQEDGEKSGVWGVGAQLLRKTYVLLMYQASSWKFKVNQAVNSQIFLLQLPSWEN